MKTIRTTLFAFALAIAFSALTPLVSQAQTTKPKLGPLSNTSLRVKRFSAEFAEWGMATDISSAHAVTFRWESKQTGVTKAYYQVSDEDLSFDTKPETMLKAVARGLLGELPAAGSVKQFDIDFATIAPAEAPASPKTYFVRIITVDDKGRVVGAPSLSVRVMYSQTNAPVKFESGTYPRPRPYVQRKH